MTIKSYKIPIYKGKFIVCFVDKLTELQTKFNLVNIEDYDGICFSIGRSYYVAFERKSFNAGIAAHEAKHALNALFNGIGQKLETVNDEAECYLLEWMVNKIFESQNNKLTKDETKNKAGIGRTGKGFTERS